MIALMIGMGRVVLNGFFNFESWFFFAFFSFLNLADVLKVKKLINSDQYCTGIRAGITWTKSLERRIYNSSHTVNDD